MRLPTVASIAHAGVKMLLFARRRQDLSPAEFRDYYENVHMPLLKNLSGKVFPKSHERSYIVRDEPDFLARVVLGDQDDFEYDSMAILTWKDQKHFEATFALYANDDIGKQISDDEEKFTEWGRAVIVT